MRAMTKHDMKAAEPLLDAAILDRAIEGQGLTSPTLREELGPNATHVVFLRHFG